jgi:hypothetical protein
MNYIMGYIDEAAICRGDLSGLEPGENAEAQRRLAQGQLNLATVATTTPAAAPAEAAPPWLLVEQACERYRVKRRWLLKHRYDLPFMRNDSKKAMSVNREAADRYFARKRPLR